MKKIILGVISLIVLATCAIYITNAQAQYLAKQEALRLEQETLFQKEIEDVLIPEEWYQSDGYDNITDWWNDITTYKQKYATIASEVAKEVGEYLSTEQLEAIQKYSEMLQEAHTMLDMNKCVWNIESIQAEGREKKTAAEYLLNLQNAYSENAAGFKSAGVIYANGYRYTYYSSRVLYHYRTGEWIAGADGLYRDYDGYVIVASSAHSQGTILPTPFGDGKVYDSGCAIGTIDVYVNW